MGVDVWLIKLSGGSSSRRLTVSTGPDGSFVSTAACNLEVRIQVRVSVGSDFCHRGCTYTMLKTVQRHGVYIYSTYSKAAFPLTRLGARRVALRRPRGRIKNRSYTITMWPFHKRDWPCSQFAAWPAIAHVAISAFIHHAFISPFVFLNPWGVSRHVWQPSKHETLNQCCFNAGLLSVMLAEHLFKIGSTSHIFWVSVTL